MKKILVVFLFVSILGELKAQLVREDSLELLYQTYLIKEMDRGLFKNINHPDSSLYVMYNNIRMDSVYNPVHYEYKNFNIFFYPRSYIMGHNIADWMVIDSLNYKGDAALLHFRIIHSKDNWVEKNDTPMSIGEIYFKRTDNGSWTIQKKKIQKYLTEKQ